jgi:hypothetical protein
LILIMPESAGKAQASAPSAARTPSLAERAKVLFFPALLTETLHRIAIR